MINHRRIWQKCAVAWLILSSGAPFYMKYNMFLCMFIMMLIAVWGLVEYRRCNVSRKNFFSFSAYVLFIIVSILITGTDGVIVNEVLILLGRLFFLLVICTNIRKEDFILDFIGIVYYISIISLVCFFVLKVNPNIHLPFEMNVESINWKGTFYYTLGFYNNATYRNAGVFGEGGLFQIFTNLALFLSIHLEGKGKKRTKHLIVFIIATLTTLSTMGYICLLLVFSSVLYRNKAKGRYYVLIMLLAVIIIIIDNSTGVISNKLLNQGGSFGSRFDDLLVSWLATMEKPLFGYGIASSDYLSGFMRHASTNLRITSSDYIILQRSNGIGILMMRCGLLYTAYFIWRLFVFSRNNVVKERINALLFAAILFLGVFNEPIGQTTIYMLVFFDFCNNYQNGINVRSD